MSTQLLCEETGHIEKAYLKGDCVRPGCLGQLKGPICDWKDSTRNDHYYSHEHWQRVFNLPWVKEAMETKTLFGEADHPKDRVEARLTKAAVVLVDYEERIEEQDYIGTFDILDTPCGKILRTLAEYGCKLGVSSRGKGSLKKVNGRNTVDVNSYIFGGFDVVALPAVKKARQDFIAESVEFDSMTESIKSQINECSDVTELNIMKDMLCKNESFSDLVEQINTKITKLSPQAPCEEKPDNTIIEGLTKDLKSAYDRINDQESLIRKYESHDLANTISLEESMDNLQLINDLLQENQSCHEVIESLQAELKSSSGLINKLQFDNVMSPSLKDKSKMIGLREQVTELRDVIRAKSNKLKDNSKLIEELTTELQSTRKIASDLKEEVNCNNIEYSQAVNELEEVNQKLSSSEDLVAETKAQLEEYQTKVEELEDLLQSKDEEYKDLLQSKDEEFEEHCNKVASELESQNEAYSSLRESYRKLKESYNELSNKSEEDSSNYDELSSRYEELKDSYDDLSAQYEELESKQEEAKAESMRLEEESQEELRHSQLEIDRLTDEVSKVNAELDDSVNDYNQLVDNFNLIVDENQKLKDFYIDQKSTRLGLSAETIKQRLPEGYTLADIDSIVESVFGNRHKIGKLPIMTPKFRTNQEAVMKSPKSLDESMSNSELAVARSMLRQMK